MYGSCAHVQSRILFKVYRVSVLHLGTIPAAQHERGHLQRAYARSREITRPRKRETGRGCLPRSRTGRGDLQRAGAAAGRVITKNTPAADARQADVDLPEKCSAGPPREGVRVYEKYGDA